MKNATVAFILVLITLYASQALSVERWEEGTHYTILDKPSTQEPQIREYFSFWCVHCYRFEPLVEKVKQQKPSTVKFEKMHVNFMGFTSKENQDSGTKALVIARALKRSDELNAAIFDYIHQKHGAITGLKDFKDIFAIHDVPPETFDKLASSFGVNSMVKKNDKVVQDYRTDLGSVPNFIINGKYQVIYTKDETMTPDDIVDLMIWLSTQP